MSDQSVLAGEAGAPARPTFRRSFARIDRVAAVLVPVVLLAVLAWSHRWIADDGLINVRVVRQLIHGHGPVFNIGERVEVGTSPLWVYVLAAARLVIPIDIGRLAVFGGLALSLAGLTLAQLASLSTSGSSRARRAVVVPVGGLVVAALPPFWDFATSGLETGLSFAWLGASLACLAFLVRRRDDRRLALGSAVVIGLGPLVRPDLGIITVCFLAALVVLLPRHGWRDLLVLAVAAAALPVAYEIFRMGYYGLPVPNPALAKEASRPRLGQGWHYLWDLVGTYWLLVPLAAIAFLVRARVQDDGGDRRHLVPIAAAVAAGVLHGAYIVFVGGDFMSGRLLLPAVFCLASAVGVVALPWPPTVDWRQAVRLVAVCAVVVWAVVAGTGLRLPYGLGGRHGIVDERSFYRYNTGSRYPITGADYRKSTFGRWAVLGSRVAAENQRQLCFADFGDPDVCRTPVVGLAGRWHAPAAIVAGNLGAVGAETPDDLFIVDRTALADAVAAHMAIRNRGRPGHEKELPTAWILARFADPASPVPPGVDAADVERARRALQCGRLRSIDRTATAPLTVGRFFSNLLGAPARMSYRFDTGTAGADHSC